MGPNVAERKLCISSIETPLRDPVEPGIPRLYGLTVAISYPLDFGRLRRPHCQTSPSQNFVKEKLQNAPNLTAHWKIPLRPGTLLDKKTSKSWAYGPLKGWRPSKFLRNFNQFVSWGSSDSNLWNPGRSTGCDLWWSKSNKWISLRKLGGPHDAQSPETRPFGWDTGVAEQTNIL